MGSAIGADGEVRIGDRGRADFYRPQQIMHEADTAALGECGDDQSLKSLQLPRETTNSTPLGMLPHAPPTAQEIAGTFGIHQPPKPPIGSPKCSQSSRFA